MRRVVLLSVMAARVLALATGAALAVNKMCASNCTGTNENARLVGSARATVIHAAGGNDKVYGNEGDD